MGNKRQRKKRATLERAAPAFPLGGALMYVPPNYAQSLQAQTYYGSSLKNSPSQWTSLFSPGVPLPPQPAVNPQGRPVQWKFPIAWNTFPVDRTQGNPDIPSFEQLRRLAKLYSGIGLCERVWLDLVPRMTLKIGLRPDLIVQGAEERRYQKEISYFTKFFEKPDGQHDQHTWLRMALREQTQIDELYLYKHRTRGGQLLGLHIIAGDQMKPLLDDWGMLPEPPAYAYQQYPWGVPGMQYSTDMIIHYQESPAADSPYGFSRVERFIMEVNQALRKKKKDLAYFTEGNQPFALMQVPESLNWTPDQIDAYEQSWNALIAGNAQQQIRVKFTQPGMIYTPIEQYQLLTDFDKFLLNMACASYGMSMGDLGFTQEIHKSAGDSQQNMLYRRTIDPLATIYAAILTDCMQQDFPPDLHGDMFVASFGGYEEAEDLGAMATAYSTLTNAGILGLSNAAKLLQLPEDPDAPHIGRVFFSKDGPIFLDDMASDKMRDAALQARLAGFQLAANPPQPEEKQQPGEEEEDESSASSKTEVDQGDQEGDTGDDSKPATRSAANGIAQSRTEGLDQAYKALSAEYRRWRQRALDDVKAGRIQRGFTTTLIPEPIHRVISSALARVQTADQVRLTFQRVQESELTGGQALLEYDPIRDIWEPWDTDEQIKAMQEQGTAFLRWTTGVSNSGVCPVCSVNDGTVVPLGKPFPSGHRLPACHPNCFCSVDRLDKEKQVMK